MTFFTRSNDVCDVIALVQLLKLSQLKVTGHLLNISAGRSYSGDKEPHPFDFKEGWGNQHGLDFVRDLLFNTNINFS